MGSPLEESSTAGIQDARAQSRGTGHHPESPVESVLVRSLRMTGSPRLTHPGEEHVRLLAGAGTELPPIVVHRPTTRVIDGTHRVHAARPRGEEKFRARFFDGSAEDAFVLAVRSNIAHGLPLRSAERTAAARRIIGTHPEWPDRVIAEAVGLTAARRTLVESPAQSG